MTKEDTKKRGRPNERDLLRTEGKKHTDSGSPTLISFMKRKFTFNLYPIDKIIPNSFNINVMTAEGFGKLKESVRNTKGKYLQDNPIKIWYDPEQDLYIIIDGEHRWRVCKELGYKRIPAVEEKDIDMSKIKELNVILSRNRGSDDHFKLSKLLNEEYWINIKEAEENNWEYKKKRVKTTHGKLADRFGIQISETKHIIHIYPRLKNIFQKVGMPTIFSKSGLRHFFSNRQLERLARCKNDQLREKLVDQSNKKKWSSEKIGKKAAEFNDLSKFLHNEFNQKEEELILDTLTGNSLFELKFEGMKDKITTLFIENNNDKIKIKDLEFINSKTTTFDAHNKIAMRIKEDWIATKKRKTPNIDTRDAMKDWYKIGYIGDPAFSSFSRMTWDFFKVYYKGEIPCIACKKLVEFFEVFSPHHEKERNWDYVCYIFLDGVQKIFPIHRTCHKPGYSKDWRQKKDE